MKNLSSFINYKSLYGILFILCLNLNAQEYVVDLTEGTEWPVPCGVTSITVEAWGAGGGGGAAFNFFGGANAGGGGGAYSKRTIPVSNGDVFTYNIGQGGSGGVSGKDGGDTSFGTSDSPYYVLAKGGQGAQNNSAYGFGAGGSATSSIGDTTWAGGNGGRGSGSGTLDASGGGGGAGRPTTTEGNGGNGGDGSSGFLIFPGQGGSGGASSAPGGNGGRGANGYDFQGGVDGENFGGGGGGGKPWVLIVPAVGGSGANGGIRITYTLPDGENPPLQEIPEVTATPDQVGCLGTETVTLYAGNSSGNFSTFWYEDAGAPEFSFIEEFIKERGSYEVIGGGMNVDPNQGTRRVIAESNNPYIEMGNVLTDPINPDIQKYIVLRYRVITGGGGEVKIHFTKNGGVDYEAGDVVTSPLIADNKWHIMNIDMSQNPNWNNSGGNITGWRFHFATIDGSHLYYDYLVLSSKPAIEFTSNSFMDDYSIQYTVPPTVGSKVIGARRIAENTPDCNNAIPYSSPKTTTINRINKTFVGDGNWNDPSKWTPTGVPQNFSCVRIPNQSNVEVNDLTAVAGTLLIEEGGSLIINPNSSLIVYNEIQNLSDAESFVVESDGNLIQINDNVLTPFQIKVNRHVQDMNNDMVTGMDYVYWSSPVQQQGLQAFSANSPYILQYNESNDYFNWINFTNEPNFISGKGYAISAETGSEFPNPYNKQYTFQGNANNGLINFTIKKNGAGYNLIGNPYPSNIDLNQLYLLNEDLIDFHFELWSNETYTPQQQGDNYNQSNYYIYNASGMIPPGEAQPDADFENPNIVSVGQGFIVRKTDGGDGNILFNNSIRRNLETQFYQKLNVEKDRFWITMQAPSGIYQTMLIGFLEGATDGYDKNFDAEEANSSDAIFTLNGDYKFSIEGFEYPVENHDIIPMGIRSYQEGKSTIFLRHTEGIFSEDVQIFLHDKYNNLYHNLNDGAYEFELPEGEITDRFELLFKHELMNSEDDYLMNNNDIRIVRQNDHILITSSFEKILNVEIFELTGRLLFSKDNINSTEIRIPAFNLGKQIIVVNTQTENGKIISKKFINK